MFYLAYVLFFTVTFCKSYLRAHTSEAYVAALLVLVFPHAEVAADVLCNIFPRTAAHYLARHLVGVFLCHTILVFWIEVAGELVDTFDVHSLTLPAISYRPKSLGE